MRILFFVHPGDHTRLVLRDFVKGFEQAGHEAVLMELAPLWNSFAAQPQNQGKLMAGASESLVRVIREQKVEATCAMEGLGLKSFAHVTGRGKPLTVFDVAKIPHLLFWFDSPIWADAGRYTPQFGSALIGTKALVHLLDNPATAREARERLGFTNTTVTPWAADPEVFKPAPDIKPEFDLVASCGKGNPNPTPLALKELESDSPDFAAVRRDMVTHLTPIAQKFAQQSPKPAEVGAFLEKLIESQVESRHVPLLDRMQSVAAQDYKLSLGLQVLTAAPGAFVQAGRIVRNIEISERAFTISWLSRRFNTLIFGDHNLAPWGVKGEQAPAVHHEKIGATLARGRVALHTARWQDDAGLGTRPFEIAACGLAGLVQRRPGVEALFAEGSEMQFFDSPADAGAKLKALLADDSARARIGEAARARAAKDHTWKNRAEAVVPAILAAKQRLA